MGDSVETLSALLSQIDSSHANAPETLADTLRKHAKDLTDADLESLVAGLREQRSRWSLAQAQGSHKRVTSKKVMVTPAKPAITAGAGFTIKIKPVL